MDPATIIGTTSAILSFVEFTGKIISTAVEIHKSLDGATNDNLTLESTVANFEKVFKDVQSKISSTPTRSVAGTSTNKDNFARDSLIQTLAKCQSLGERISDLLQKTKAVPASRLSMLDHLDKWRRKHRKSHQVNQTNSGPVRPTLVEVMRATIRTVWHKEELNDLREEWEVCLIQFKIDFSNLQTSEGLGGIHVALQTQSLQLDEIRHLIHSLVDGGQLTQLVNFVDKLQEADSLQNMEKRNTAWILAALEFPGIDSRRRQVETAAKSTFEWCVTQDSVPRGHLGLKISFRKWLRTGNGVYHITGKPGSGKSTLVKFIETADETQQQLEQWAYGKRLVRASFYVWKAAEANPLQCQFEGLTRTLLYQILKTSPELTRVAFPKLWCPHQFTLLNAILQGSSEPSRLELEGDKVLRALRNILQLSEAVNGYRFFLLVDAMDEFEETNALLHAEIVRLIQSWSSFNTEAVKICVSSREEAAFMDNRFFQPIERLRLHLVTENDVRALVRHRLINGENGLAAMEQHQRLIERIVQRAEGVFLWVVLVTREIQHRLVEKQSAEELHEAVELFPGELNEVFVEVLRRIRTAYRKEAWAVFTVAASIEHHWLFDLFHYSMLQEHFSRESASIHKSLPKISWDDAHCRVQNFINRFPSLSQGLLDLRDGYVVSPLGTKSPATYRSLVFAHRSVHDFIKENPKKIADGLAPGVTLSGSELVCQALCNAVDVLPLDGQGGPIANVYGPILSEILLKDPITTGLSGTLASDLISLEASLLSKQKVIPEKKAFDSVEARDLLITPATVCILFEALWSRRNHWYVEWALDKYPPWVLDKILASKAAKWFLERNSRASEREHAFHTLVQALCQLANEPRLDWSVNDPTVMEYRYFWSNSDENLSSSIESLPPLQASTWLITILFVLHSESRNFCKLHSYEVLDALHQMLLVGAEPRIEFRWWYRKNPSQPAQSIVNYTDSVVRAERSINARRSRSTIRLQLPLLKPQDQFRMTVQEGDYPEQVIQDYQWAWHENKNCIVSFFVNKFGDSGSVPLRDVLLKVIDALEAREEDPKILHMSAAEIQVGRKMILKALDDVLSKAEAMKTNDQPNQETSQDTIKSGQQAATAQEVQIHESGHGSVRRKGESANTGTLPLLGGKETGATRHIYNLASILHDWKVVILAVTGAFISMFIWNVLGKGGLGQPDLF